MFVNPKELKKLMKEAHRINNLIIGCRDNLYYIQGSFWKVLCKKKFVPKTILAEIIELAGEIPGEGECFCSGKDGNQMQFNTMEIEIPEEAEEIEVTDYLLQSKHGVMQRLLQFPGTRNVYLINDRIVQMTKGKHYDEDQGETQPEGPYCSVEHGVFWKNDVMKFSVCFRVDDEHFETLQQMKMIRLWNVNQEPER